MKRYGIAEIFGPTIQGEGSNMGRSAVFVRFAGCNMWDGKPETRADSKCPFCDTDFRRKSLLTAEEIVAEVHALGGKEETQVVCSGGEPLLQMDAALGQALCDPGFNVAVETNGTARMPPGLACWVHHVTLSPKVPAKDLKLHRCHDLKVLYPRKGMYPRSYVQTVWHQHRYVQPIESCDFGGANASGTTLSKCLDFVAKHPDWRLSPQVHKLIGVK